MRPQFATYKLPRIPSYPENNIQEPDEIDFVSADMLGGLIADGNPEKVPDNGLQNLVNGTYINNQLFRRNGLSTYSLTKPDSNPVLNLFAFNNAATGVHILRTTKSSIYRATNTGFSVVTGPALVGANTDKFRFTVADDRLFFTNNGANVIQEYDPVAHTYAALGDADQYQYITSAFNRVVAASQINIPYQIAWSGSLNYGEWNPSTDITAGFTPLVNSPADLSDPITGIFSIGALLVIPRQKSLWLATNLPSATQPFYFFPDTAAPRIGCDCPNTIAQLPNGLVFYSFHNSTLYYYIPGHLPQEVSTSSNVKRAIKAKIGDPSLLFGSYNPDSNVYSLLIPSGNLQTIVCFDFSFETENWSYSEFNSITSCDDVDYSSSELTIADLTGTINGLAGSINQLGGIASNSSRFFGDSSGNLFVQPLFTGEVLDVPNIVSQDGSTSYTFTADSKRFSKDGYEIYFNKISVEYTPFTIGSVSLQYSKDGGLTFKPYKTISVTSDMLFTSQVILANRPIRSRTFQWRFTTSDCMLSLNKYRIEGEEAGIATK